MQQRGAMEEPMWRKMFLFFILQFTGAQSRDLSLFYTVRAGDDVTLSCENVIEGHSKCDTTTWIYSKPGDTSVELVAHGQVKDSRSDRLSVSPNCSLVVKKVTADDVGQYICRQFPIRGGGQSGPDAAARLSLVQLSFSSRPSEKDETTTTSPATTKPVKIQNTEETTATTKPDETSGNRMTSINTPTSAPPVEQSFLWLYVTLPLLLVALITTLFILLKRARGHKAKQISNDGVTLTQSASETQQQVDPENGVSYASISYTKKSSSSRAKDDDEGETVTYSTVKSPAVDPSSLYASIK